MGTKEKPPKMSSAWLLTWEESHRFEVAGIYPSRYAWTRIAEIMRAIYLSRCYVPHEQFYFARHPKEGPEVRTVAQNDVPRLDLLVIWDAGPALYGRKVDNLSVKLTKESTEELAAWTERPQLRYRDKKRGEVESAGPGKARQIVRKIGISTQR